MVSLRVKNDVRIAKDHDIPSGYQPKDDEKLVIESTNRNKDTVLIKVDAPPKPGLTKVADVGKTDPPYVIARLVDMEKGHWEKTLGTELSLLRNTEDGAEKTLRTEPILLKKRTLRKFILFFDMAR